MRTLLVRLDSRDVQHSLTVLVFQRVVLLAFFVALLKQFFLILLVVLSFRLHLFQLFLVLLDLLTNRSHLRIQHINLVLEILVLFAEAIWLIAYCHELLLLHVDFLLDLLLSLLQLLQVLFQLRILRFLLLDAFLVLNEILLLSRLLKPLVPFDLGDQLVTLPLFALL